MTIQYIENNGKRQYAIVPVDLFDKLLEKAEMLDDIKAFDAAISEDEESIPFDMLKRLMDGDNPLKVWREHRGLTQIELSTQAGVAQSTIAQIETGQRTGTVTMLKKLANVLAIDLDDLV